MFQETHICSGRFRLTFPRSLFSTSKQ